MTAHKPTLRNQSYWETVGGKHGRFGKYKPWYAQEIAGWEPDPERPLQRRKVVARREGPFRTKTEAEAFIESDRRSRPHRHEWFTTEADTGPVETFTQVEACACGEQR